MSAGSTPAAARLASSLPAVGRRIVAGSRLHQGEAAGRVDQEGIDGRAARRAEIVGQDLAGLVRLDVAQDIDGAVEEAVAESGDDDVADAAVIDAGDLLLRNLDHAVMSSAGSSIGVWSWRSLLGPIVAAGSIENQTAVDPRSRLGLNDPAQPLGQGEQRSMPAAEKSPNKVYLEHLERGELAYQFSPEAGKAVFYPRVLCPFTGSSKLEWRVSKGLGTVYATTVVHPRRGRALQRGPDRLRRGLPPDEPGGGHRTRQGADRPARAPARASQAGDEDPMPAVRTCGGRVMEGLKRGSAAIVGVAESDLGHVAEGLSVIDLMAQGVHARARRLRAEAEGRRRAVLGDDAEPAVGGGAGRVSGARPAVHRLDHRRRLVVRVPRRPRHERRSRRACATSR